MINMRASGQLHRVAGDHDAILAQFYKALLHHVGDELAGALIGEHLLLGLSKFGLELLHIGKLLLDGHLPHKFLHLVVLKLLLSPTPLAADLHEEAPSAPRL
jgi:hypothetical protein